jgi:hypothetical protein
MDEAGTSGEEGGWSAFPVISKTILLPRRRRWGEREKLYLSTKTST